MKPTFTDRGSTCVRIRHCWSLSAVAILLAALGTAAQAEPVTIFWDDFEGYEVGANPTLPPIGNPWEISEVAPDSIDVTTDASVPENQVLWFGRYRNKALVPFSAADRQLIAEAQNATIHFDYYGFSANGGSQYFDIASYCSIDQDPTFFLRFSPTQAQEPQGFHAVEYLDPSQGLIDTGLLIAVDTIQSVNISLDFDYEVLTLDVAGNSVELPMSAFVCPDDLGGVEFANYGGPIGSGTIDNLGIDVQTPDRVLPELTTVTLLAAGGVALGLWSLLRKESSDK